MNINKNLVFFVLFSFATNLFAETYLNSEEVKQLLNKIEAASATSNVNGDSMQKELQEIQKKVDLANQQRNLENAKSNTGLNQESIEKRVNSLESYYRSTNSVEEFIFNDSFSYQLICKNNKDCKPTASVESEVFNSKLQSIRDKIANDKVAMVKGIKNIQPLDDSLNLVRQIEQTTYSANSNLNNMNNNYNNFNSSDNSKQKKFIEVRDGDIFGNVKISITQSYIKLSKK
ncbi:hypothetical protein [Aliarcobacter butzleri]|uniref:hypothetical protein n=1 Tax=Aliarcobacter butzleri TaxID=28197 RepID=UPI00126A520D|nr:hypothetical protein [Aliarcobacter butzleri]